MSTKARLAKLEAAAGATDSKAETQRYFEAWRQVHAAKMRDPAKRESILAWQWDHLGDDEPGGQLDFPTPAKSLQLKGKSPEEREAAMEKAWHDDPPAGWQDMEELIQAKMAEMEE